MAIAFDSFTDGGVSTTGQLALWSHTCSGSNRILFVHVLGDGTSDLVTAASYDGQSMSLINKVRTPSDRWLYLFYLIAPHTGNNIVIASASSSISGWGGMSASYTGASQTGQPDASTTNTASSVSSITTTVTSVANNCWTVMSGGYSAGTPSAGTGTLLRAGTGGGAYLDSNGRITPAGSTSLILNSTSSTRFGAVMASFSPFLFVLTTANTPFTLTGVNVGLSHLRRLIANVASFILTGLNISASSVFKWTNQSKNSSSWTNTSKNSSSWTNQSKN